MNKEVSGSLTILLSGILLLVITLILDSGSLVHKTIYLCYGSLFGIGMSLLAFKAEETRKLPAERVARALVKLVLVFVILLTPIYIVPLYYVYLYDSLTWLLLHISGALISGGIAMLIVAQRRKEVLKPTNELKLTSKLFIIASTSVILLTIGCAVTYAFHSAFFMISGMMLIFFGLVFLIYARKVRLVKSTKP